MELKFEDYNFYIKPAVTDMRKGSRGLAIIVQNEMKIKPFSESVFLFCGRSKRTIKAIVWDKNGWFVVINSNNIGPNLLFIHYYDSLHRTII
ncbi:MAG: IS66 family insertion sequence element accessory protein TnpB [Proteiniphilum sp.]|nr:IS66 family insertion sequence element accessory protein TnpB [Proteiniphilum sp.]